MIDADATFNSTGPSPEEPASKARRRWGPIVTIVLLSVALAAALAVFVLAYLQLTDANARIEEQDRQLEEQRELIDQKETFGAAMEVLLETSAKFDGVLVGDVVPVGSHELLAVQAWAHRWKSDALDADIAGVQAATEELEALLAAAGTEATTNGTGSKSEAVIDELGAGFVSSLMEDADSVCESDVSACVMEAQPDLVHFDAADDAAPYMTDWLRTGLAYHEFAHVLQYTNPIPTEAAAEAFGGDWETMADCYALTFLDGWTLDHRIWVSSYQYWDVSQGYGYTCNDDQRQVMRDWHAQLGFQTQPISQ